MAFARGVWTAGLMLVCCMVYQLEETMAEGSEDYFCSQFFTNISSRTPLEYEIEDNYNLGWTLQVFERPPKGRHPSKHWVEFTSGDVDIVNFDFSSYALVLKGSPRPKLGGNIVLNGTCYDYLYPLSYQFELEITVNVTVLDANDPPQLTNLPGTLYISENATVGSILHTVEVDNSWDMTEEFADSKLVLESVTAQEVSRATDWHTFELDPYGRLTLHQPLDFEKGPRTYKLQISATDKGGPPLTSTSYLIIYVLDVDDMAPAFSVPLYHAEVMGERPVERDRQECFNTTPVMYAEDGDRSLKSTVNYEIIEGSPGTRVYWGKFFRVDRETGVLCQKETVQRLVKDDETGRLGFYNFTFTVKAYQTDNPDKFDTAAIFVHVIDSNQHAPEFSRRRYRVSMAEYPDVAFQDKVVQLRAADKDHGLNSRFEYQLLTNPLRAFAVDPKSGLVTVLRPYYLDRETNSTMELRAMVKETDTVDMKSDTCRIIVELEDVNDNAPVFHQENYNYTDVKNTLQNGYALTEFYQRVQATDVDQGDNGHVTYSISKLRRSHDKTSFSDFGRFAIDPDSGLLRLAGSLRDLRRKREYPEFIVQVQATDRALDEKQRKSSFVDVHIRIREANEHAPSFPHANQDGGPLRVNASEDLPVGTVVASVPAEDLDGDEDVYLKYSISDGNDDDFFAISSVGWLSLRKPLDREIQSTYNLKIQVTDGVHNASTSVDVIVDDVNDNTPTFDLEEVIFHLQEESPTGTVVGSVIALDPDIGLAGQIRYSLRKTDRAADVFSIDPETGELFTTKSSDLLDRELRTKLELKVIAADQGVPSLQSSVDVTVLLDDINDNSPLFTAPLYTGRVFEDDQNPRPQIVVLDIPINATDGDADEVNRDVTYSISGPSSHIFDMNPKTADIVVSSPGTIDGEQEILYTLQVSASDQGGNNLPSTAVLLIEVIDNNDNTPVFENRPTLALGRHVTVGSVIGDVRAVDSDVTKPNNEVIYILKRGGYGKFSVDYETGELLVVDDLGREPVMADYELEIQALDGGLPRLSSSTHIHIQVPINHPPVIHLDSTHMNVKENLSPGTWVGQLVVTDEDVATPEELLGELTYHIADPRVPFEIGGKSGAITTKQPLDHEIAATYEFMVHVHDSGHPQRSANATLRVDVQDVNDNAPSFNIARFHGSLTEDDRHPWKGQPVVLTVNISTVDYDVTHTDIVLSLKGDLSDWFTIDSTDGSIVVSEKGTGRIDREKYGTIQLQIVATDTGGTGLSSTADLLLHVRDVNDVTPQFSSIPREMLVNQEVREGENIGRIYARDGDATSPNNKVLYILENDVYGKFRLDLRTGLLSVTRGIFHQPRQEVYVLQVTALDLGDPSRTSRTAVTVRVLKRDFNDFRPEFLGENIFYVNEESPPGTVVGVLHIIDEDIGSGTELTLSIDSDEPVPFHVDSQTGEIRTSQRVDCDSGRRAYSFFVFASDNGSPPRESATSVGIILIDVNDNPPRFTQSVYRHRVSDVFPAGTIVATPFAYDDIDTPSARSFYRYSLEALQPNAGQYFDMDPHSGVITTTRELGRSARELTRLEYRLIATDTHNELLGSSAMFVVDIDHANSTGSGATGGGSGCCCEVPCAVPEQETQP